MPAPPIDLEKIAREGLNVMDDCAVCGKLTNSHVILIGPDDSIVPVEEHERLGENENVILLPVCHECHTELSYPVEVGTPEAAPVMDTVREMLRNDGLFNIKRKR